MSIYSLIAQHLLRPKEPLYLGFSSFWAITGVCDVHHLAVLRLRAEFGADGARGGELAIGHAEHIADFCHNVVAFEDDGDHRSGTHEVFYFRVEGLLGDVRVVLAEDFWREVHHFARADREACCFKTVDDLATKLTADGVWL